MRKILFLALAGLAAIAAIAQTKAPGDPLDPQAPVPAMQYRSAFEGYRPYDDPPVARWRDSNDQVKGLGGHSGHVAKPDSARAPKPESDSASGKSAKPGGHEGHHR